MSTTTTSPSRLRQLGLKPVSELAERINVLEDEIGQMSFEGLSRGEQMLLTDAFISLGVIRKRLIHSKRGALAEQSFKTVLARAEHPGMVHA